MLRRDFHPGKCEAAINIGPGALWQRPQEIVVCCSRGAATDGSPGWSAAEPLETESFPHRSSPVRGDRNRVAPHGATVTSGTLVPGVPLRSTPGYHRSPLRGYIEKRQDGVYRSRRGLTLLELVVVLAILAALALAAVVATESAVDQARFEISQRTLENIDTAGLGPAGGGTASDTHGFAGFGADIGRPPVSVGADSDSGTQLAELWSNPSALRIYSAAATSDPNIIVFS